MGRNLNIGADKELEIALYANKTSLSKTAQKFGVSQSSVTYYRKKHGVSKATYDASDLAAQAQELRNEGVGVKVIAKKIRRSVSWIVQNTVPGKRAVREQDYSPERKSEILDYCSANGPKRTSEKYGVGLTTLGVWRRNMAEPVSNKTIGLHPAIAALRV